MKIKHLFLALLLIPGLTFATSQSANSDETIIDQLASWFDSYASQVTASQSFTIPQNDEDIIHRLKSGLRRTRIHSAFNKFVQNLPAARYLDKTEMLLFASKEFGLFDDKETQNFLRAVLVNGSDETLQLVAESLAHLKTGSRFFWDTRVNSFDVMASPDSNSSYSEKDYFNRILTEGIKRNGRKLGILFLHACNADPQSVVYKMAQSLLEYVRNYYPEQIIRLQQDFADYPDSRKLIGLHIENRLELLNQLQQFVTAHPQQRAVASAEIENSLGEQNIIPDLSRIVTDYALPQIPVEKAAAILAIPIPLNNHDITQQLRAQRIAQPDPVAISSIIHRQANEEKKKKE